MSEGFELARAQIELNRLCERSAKDAKDNEFAVKSSRRQLARYVTWWTKKNGYYPGRDSDISAHAQALVRSLPD